MTVGGRPKEWDAVIRDAFARTNVSDYAASVTEIIELSRDVRSRIIPPLVCGILQAQKYPAFRGSPLTVYDLPFVATNPGADGGVELLNSMMKVDRLAPHPFKPDVRGMMGFTSWASPGSTY